MSEEILGLTLICRNKGIITVGPVITINAENISDNSKETPKIKWVAKKH